MASTAAQIKGRIKSLAVKNEADPRVLMRMYMMERFLRMRDYYDIYTLLRTHNQDINYKVLRAAYTATCEKRGSIRIIGNEEEIVENLGKHTALSDLWIQYQQKYSYASEITYQQVIDSIRKILSYIR